MTSSATKAIKRAVFGGEESDEDVKMEETENIALSEESKDVSRSLIVAANQLRAGNDKLAKFAKKVKKDKNSSKEMKDASEAALAEAERGFNVANSYLLRYGRTYDVVFHQAFTPSDALTDPSAADASLFPFPDRISHEITEVIPAEE